eukprot:Nk52_evm1s595 gene=Nk52_evmTU1s595
MGKCKEALIKTENDYSKAKEWLMEQQKVMGWAKIQKLSSRATSEGLVAVKQNENVGALVEVRCETDFVARNDSFQEFVACAAQAGFALADKKLTSGKPEVVSVASE